LALADAHVDAAFAGIPSAIGSAWQITTGSLGGAKPAPSAPKLAATAAFADALSWDASSTAP
jgi:hypothetical protein